MSVLLGKTPVQRAFEALTETIMRRRLEAGDSLEEAIKCVKALNYNSFAMGYETARIGLPFPVGCVSIEDAECLRNLQYGQSINITVTKQGQVPVFIAETSH